MSEAPPAGAGMAAVAWDRLRRGLQEQGAAFAGVAAAVLVARGSAGLDPEAFARRLRIATAHLRLLESGRAGPLAVPHRLVPLAPALDWSALGVDVGSPGDPAARHPAAGRRHRARAGGPGRAPPASSPRAPARARPGRGDEDGAPWGTSATSDA